MNNTSSQANWSVVGRMAFMFTALFTVMATPALARDNVSDPASRVARLSFLSGDVSVQIAESGEWIQGRLNRPLTNRDQVMTDGGSRAELQIGMASIHLDENTQLGLMELSDNVLQVQLNQGVANIAVRGMDNDDTIEIDTPNSSITIPEPGSYRVEVGADDDVTVVQVRNGSAEVAGERQRYTVREKEQLRLRGSKRLNAQFDDLDRLDDFDRWVASRNARARNATAARYVDVNVIGYEDLDDYGYWRWEAGYGDVWYPNRVARGWSPYRYGHWEWISPWGWTWIDDQPWGFAPFHYGRWVEVHHRWCWTPGRREVRAVYAPALVAWVGAPGVSLSLNISSGPVGWIPLGPREIFHPHYVASAVYLSRVNVGTSLLDHDEVAREIRRRDRDDVFVNRRAVSVISTGTLASGGSVHRNLMPGEQRSWRPLESIRDLRPERSAIIGNSKVISPPVRAIDREVIGLREPAPFVSNSARRDISVGGSVRLIQPIHPRRGGNDNPLGERRWQTAPDNTVTQPNQIREDSRRVDRWGRDNQLENRNDNNRTQEPPNTNQRREWRVTAPDENGNRDSRNQRDTNNQNNQNRVIQPEANQTPEPERRRIGPWIREEQQLRPEPPRQQEPPAPRQTPPRVEPPRANTPPPSPPPQNNSPPNNQGGERPGRDRREIR